MRVFRNLNLEIEPEHETEVIIVLQRKLKRALFWNIGAAMFSCSFQIIIIFLGHSCLEQVSSSKCMHARNPDPTISHIDGSRCDEFRSHLFLETYFWKWGKSVQQKTQPINPTLTSHLWFDILIPVFAVVTARTWTTANTSYVGERCAPRNFH